MNSETKVIEQDNAFTRFQKKYAKQNDEAKPQSAPRISSDSQNQNEEQSPESILEKIKGYKWARPQGRKNKLSSRLVLGHHSEIQAAVCEATGIVYGIIMPVIPGGAFLVESPFASYSNCRGMAQKGRDYLNQQSNQILAGILITLAENYSFLSYPLAATGASKNALLRMADKDTLIDAIILIEEWVNTNNSFYLPKLSLSTDADSDMDGKLVNMNDRLRRWMSTCVDCIYKPDRRSYEEVTAIKRTISVPTVSKARRAKAAEKAQLNKDFKAWKAKAKDDIVDLFKNKIISLKLKTYFLAIIKDLDKGELDPAMIELMGGKLQQLDSPMAKDLGTSLISFQNRFSSEEETEDDLETDFESSGPGRYIEAEDSEEDQSNDEDWDDSSSAKSEPAPIINPVAAAITEPDFSKMSFTEKILYKKKMARLAQENQGEVQSKQPISSIENENKGDNDAPF